MRSSLALKLYIIYFAGSLIVFQRDLYAVATLSTRYVSATAIFLSVWFFALPLLGYAVMRWRRHTKDRLAHAIDKRD